MRYCHSTTALSKLRRRSLHGQTRAKGQSGSQEAQKGEDQDNCCRSKSKDRRLAADNRLRQKEIARRRRRALDRAIAEATPGRRRGDCFVVTVRQNLCCRQINRGTTGQSLRLQRPAPKRLATIWGVRAIRGD